MYVVYEISSGNPLEAPPSGNDELLQLFSVSVLLRADGRIVVFLCYRA